MVELHLIAKGRVQGVFFRAASRDLAKSLGLTGWVKNLPNGDVELVAQGEKEALQTLLDELASRFDATFTTTFRPPSHPFPTFTIQY